jgi:hypothetical protein
MYQIDSFVNFLSKMPLSGSHEKRKKKKKIYQLEFLAVSVEQLRFYFFILFSCEPFKGILDKKLTNESI